jgi:sortase A
MPDSEVPAADSSGADPNAPVSSLVTDPPRAARHRRTPMGPGDQVRFFLRGVGQTLITAGVVVLLFVVYEVYITNYFSHREQTKVHNALEHAWDNGDDPLALPGGDQSGIPLGSGIANIYIPRLGRDFAFTVVQGTDESSLEKGPGHYVGTSLPGDTGNFAVAGHRVGKGEPFLNLDHLRPGDAVIIETKSSWYVYQVIGDVKTHNLSARDGNGVPGREIVSPSDGRVLLPIPDQPGHKPTNFDRYMTMTTCHPKFTANQRMIVHAQLLPKLTAPRVGSKMPAAISNLYNAKGL